MAKRFCPRCLTRHTAPTGRNCTLPVNMDFFRDGNQFAPEDDNVVDEEVQLGAVGGAAPALDPVVGDRLDRLEAMMVQLSGNIAQLAPTRGRSPPRSPDSDGYGDHDRGHRRRKDRSPSKSRDRYAYENIFLDDDFVVKSFEGVMLALFKTCTDFIEDGLDLSGLIEHGQLLAEKATAGVYVSDAFVGYDKYVRALAGRKGPEMFGDTSEIVKGRYFNLENHKDVRALRGKAKAGGQKSGTCRKFNSDVGCLGKGCPYVHRCSGCEVYGHSVKDCKSSRKDKGDK